MKPKYKIVWANVAECDLKDIIEYISLDSPKNALKILKKLSKKLQSFIPFLKEAASFRNFKTKAYYNTEK